MVSLHVVDDAHIDHSTLLYLLAQTWLVQPFLPSAVACAVLVQLVTVLPEQLSAHARRLLVTTLPAWRSTSAPGVSVSASWRAVGGGGGEGGGRGGGERERGKGGREEEGKREEGTSMCRTKTPKRS